MVVRVDGREVCVTVAGGEPERAEAVDGEDRPNRCSCPRCEAVRARHLEADVRTLVGVLERHGSFSAELLEEYPADVVAAAELRYQRDELLAGRAWPNPGPPPPRPTYREPENPCHGCATRDERIAALERRLEDATEQRDRFREGLDHAIAETEALARDFHPVRLLGWVARAAVILFILAGIVVGGLRNLGLLP